MLRGGDIRGRDRARGRRSILSPLFAEKPRHSGAVAPARTSRPRSRDFPPPAAVPSSVRRISSGDREREEWCRLSKSERADRKSHPRRPRRPRRVNRWPVERRPYPVLRRQPDRERTMRRVRSKRPALGVRYPEYGRRDGANHRRAEGPAMPRRARAERARPAWLVPAEAGLTDRRLA